MYKTQDLTIKTEYFFIKKIVYCKTTLPDCAAALYFDEIAIWIATWELGYT